jgi:hypothetical protein
MMGLLAFGALFFAVAWGLRSPELEQITGVLRRRLGRR